MNTITFKVDGKPAAWQRAGRAGKRTFDTSANLSAKNAIAWACKTAMGGINPFQGAVKVSIIFVSQWPKSTTKKRKAQANGFYKETRSDLDNQIKLVCDALNGIAYVDDAQVAVIYSEKITSDHGSWTSVAIEPLWETDRASLRKQVAA